MLPDVDNEDECDSKQVGGDDHPGVLEPTCQAVQATTFGSTNIGIGHQPEVEAEKELEGSGEVGEGREDRDHHLQHYHLDHFDIHLVLDQLNGPGVVNLHKFCFSGRQSF